MLVLVAFYLENAAACEALVSDFEAAIDFVHDFIIVVDNRGYLAAEHLPDRFSVTAGDNSAWEFSGMAAGLEAVSPDFGICAVLNDSYSRNWEVSAASRPLIRAMYDAATRGKTTGWQDVFDWLPFQQRPNSRILVMTAASAGAVAKSIREAIEVERSLSAGEQALFSDADSAILDRWERKNVGRWSVDSLPQRRRRIFLEHRMLSTVEGQVPRLLPDGPLAALFYTIRRHLEGERR